MEQKILGQEEFRTVFGKRFKQALIERGIRQYDELSKNTNISRKQLSMYATGRALPTVYGLYVLCKELNFSADFFLGLTSEIEFIEQDDPVAEDILTMRESYVQMPDKARAAFQEFVKAILEQE